MQEFEISTEYRQQMWEELHEHVAAFIAEDEGDLKEALEAWHSNLMDDLHDSVGDQDYQLGVLERMQFIEHALPFLESFKEEDILREAPWAK